MQRIRSDIVFDIEDGVSCETRIVAALKRSPPGVIDSSYPAIQKIDEIEGIFQYIASENEFCCALFDAGAFFKDAKNIEVARRLISLRSNDSRDLLYRAVLYYDDKENC